MDVYVSGRKVDELPHRVLFIELFGAEFWDRVVDRIEATTIYHRRQCEKMMNECLAYLLARASLDDPNDVLVANLLPDQAWHVFIHFTAEYVAFCDMVAGTYLHHDPAGEAAFVNDRPATERTVAVFKQFGIEYDPLYWNDWQRYPNGADAIRTGVLPR